MKALKIELAYKENSDKEMATEFLYDFDPIGKIINKNPSIDEITNLIKESYNIYLDQIRKWQEMIIRSEDYIWEILKHNFDEKNIKSVVLAHDYFKVYFHEDIEYNIESYNIDDNMFYNVFESYLTDWFKSYKGYKYTIYQNEVQSFIDNLEIEFKAIEE